MKSESAAIIEMDVERDRKTCIESASADDNARPTQEQLAEAHDRARQLGLTVRGRKNFVLDDGKYRQPCGDFDALITLIKWREWVAQGKPTSIMDECDGTVDLNDKEQTSFYVLRQEDGSYKKIHGSKTDPETGERIQFDILEDGSHKETRRFPKEDDNEDVDSSSTPSATPPAVLTLARRVKALIGKGNRAAEKAEQFYKAAGIHIKEIKEQSEDWETIVRKRCGLRRSRAYELMAIADGKTTLEKVRDRSNRSSKISHAKKSAVQRTEPEPINQRVTESPEVSPEQRKADHAALADPIEEEGTDDVADPATVEDNALQTLERMGENARIFKKIFKLSSFDREAESRISAAIDGMIQKWRSTQATLNSASEEAR
jgi:hypothetical protein